MLLTMPGVPFIYYGDEIGMPFLPDTPDLVLVFFRSADW